MTKKGKPLFTKKQLLHFKRYRNRRDLLAAILTDDKLYTMEETDKLVSDFMKGKVK